MCVAVVSVSECMQEFCCVPDGNAVIRHRFYGWERLRQREPAGMEFTRGLGMMNNVDGAMEIRSRLYAVISVFACEHNHVREI